MDTQKWNKYKHFEEHITWPATKQEIINACEGEHYDKDTLKEIKMALPDGDKKYTKEEFKKMMMSEMPQMSHKQM